MHPMKEGNPMSNEAINHHSADDPSLWWKQAVVYQVYPRSFKDTTGSDNARILAHFRIPALT